jgi:NACHT domain
LLKEVYDWADGHDQRIIFWLNGLAGTGKSTIARTVAGYYFHQNRLGASFFFSRGGGDIGTASKFVTSIAVQLARNVPTLHLLICDAIIEHTDIANSSLREQWNELILNPLSKLKLREKSSPYPRTYVLVIDALDECDDENNIRLLLHLLAETRSLVSIRLRIFLTSRPEGPIRHGFYRIPNLQHQNLVLHNISPSIVDHDIYLFLEFNFKVIRQERSLEATWPGEKVIRELVQTAGGLFIWAATACRFIREGKRFAVKRLELLLHRGNNGSTAPEKQLDDIYITVLRQSIAQEYTAEEKEEACRMLRHILGSIVILLSPLSTSSLSKLLFIDRESVTQTLDDLHSILDVPKNHIESLRLHHPSFRDFLLDKNRCRDKDLQVDEKQAHEQLALACIRHMSKSLKQNFFELDDFGATVDHINRTFDPDIEYACLYWIQHLQKSGTRLNDNGQVHQFLQEHLLHWFEALCWMQKIDEGVYAVNALESITLVCQCQDFKISVFANVYLVK